MHLERLISILELIGQSGRLNVADISATLRLPKPTTYRLVKDLVEVGLLEPGAAGLFSLGARTRQIVNPDHTDDKIFDVAVPILSKAANDTGIAFFLSRLRGNSVDIIHVETPETGVSYLHPGLGRRPLHACSCAKAIAAFSPVKLIQPGFEEKMRAYTEFTLTRLENLETELSLVRQRGYAECVEEIERGMSSVAAPLSTTGDLTSLSIGGSGSMRVMDHEFRAELGQTLITVAEDICSKLSAPQPKQLATSVG